MSSTENRTISQVTREFRLFYRRLLSLFEDAEAELQNQPLSEEITISLDAQLNQLTEYQNRLDSLLSELLEQDPSDEMVNDLSEKADATNRKILKLTGEIRAAQFRADPSRKPIVSRQSIFTSTNRDNQSFGLNTSLLQTKMPKLKLPSFDGDERKFLDFKNHFTKMVHQNETLAPLDKLYYLKGSLSGKAERLIRDIPIADENYETAWRTIIERYEDKLVIIESHFSSLFAIKRIQSGKEIQELVDNVDTSLRSLELCGETPNRWPSIITYLVYSRLDEQTKIDWKKTLTDHSEYPIWEQLRKFLKTNAAAMRNVAVSSTIGRKDLKSTESKGVFAVTTRACCICGQLHLLIDCKRFIEMLPNMRLEKIRKSNLCVNCFNTGHSNFECKSKKVCKTCRRKHHTLLHIDFDKKKTEPQNNSSEKVEIEPKRADEEKTVHLASLKVTPCNSKIVLLPSALVNFQSGSIQNTLRLLMDNCSQITLISDLSVRRLKLRTFESPSQISLAVGGMKTLTNRHCQLRLQSRFNNFEIAVTAEVVSSQALAYAVNNLNLGKIAKSIQDLDLADPVFQTSKAKISSIDLLLGAEYLPDILIGETRKCDSCILQKTHFGWTLMGPVEQTGVSSDPNSTACLLTVQDIDDRLKAFWEAEEVENHQNFTKSEEQDKCEKHFHDTYERLPSGHFQVRLPLKESESSLTNNKGRACAYLKRGEKSINDSTKQQYVQFMREYETLRHMSLIASSERLRYYIPHQAVLRPTSTTTKCRVVFNASAKTYSGKSLNDILMTGPVIQSELFDLLQQFRIHKVAFTADIEKMYRCVMIHPKDRHLQSILWRENPTDQIKEYELNTVAYGTGPASYLATQCLALLARESKFETTSYAIKSWFYMDDLLAGANTIESAIQLRNDIHETLNAAQFKLRKYQSNFEELLQSIPSELVETQLAKTIGGKETISILGMEWTPKEDIFRIKLPVIPIATATLSKRKILSESAKIFDPLGLIAPITIREKILMQELWREGLGWDEIVPSELSKKFIRYHAELPLLASFAVPRPYDIEPITSAELIGFCDSSVKAYCAVIYVRMLIEQQPATIRLVCAKTRVAPLKELTIPKLELNAAVLLAKLIDRVRDNLKIQKVYAFSDSKVVLSWLAKPPETWKVYVANRVKKINSSVPYSDCWGYVPTHENPADLATRGLSVNAFLDSDLWLEGPPFIKTAFCLNQFNDPNLETEKRKSKVSCNLAVSECDYLIQCISRYSNFNHLIRVFARIIRVFKKGKYNAGILTAEDLADAETSLIRITQMYHFPAEYTRLLQESTVGKKSVMRTLNPFLDKEKIIRSATRLANANISYNRKCPVILPVKSHLLHLLIRHLHKKYFHATRNFISTYIRLRFIVTGGLTNAIKAEIRHCVTCIRHSSNINRQIMGDLPKDRLEVARAFSFVGVDFAGHFICKPTVKRSKVRFKSYVAVFVCFVSRAVHLELVPSLSTEDFLNALKRFISRRGLPNTIYSDNGTNFKGAANYLSFQAENIQNFASSEKILWKFNPPYAPHRGGLWEAAVKSMKKHLCRITQDQVLSYDEMVTLLTQVEAILNSRPLTYRKTNTDAEIICPSHLLIGDSLLFPPEGEESPVKLSTQYNALKQKVRAFWRGWTKDFLAQLQNREKWQTSSPMIQSGDVVLVRSTLLKPFDWPIARVTETYPDEKGIVRTVKIQLRNSESIRDCASLIKIPVDEAKQ